MAKVLITKNITTQHLKLLIDEELDYEVSSAVTFDIDFDINSVIQGIKNNSDWIFTSVNAVKSINLLLAKYQHKFEQKIYCVGSPAYANLTNLGYFSVEKFASEAKLSAAIDWKQKKNYTYFGSNNSRNIVHDQLKGVKSSVDHIEVYSIILNNPKIEQADFDYIFFFSPLAVKSIFRKNPNLKNCHAICIGPATERAVRDLGGKKYSISDQSNLSSMVQMIKNL